MTEDSFPLIKIDTEEDRKLFGDNETKEDEVRKQERASATEGKKESDDDGTPINAANEYTIQFEF